MGDQLAPDSDVYVAADERSGTLEVRDFFRVAKLVPPDQDVVSVAPGTSVGAAIHLMRSRGFSQLPVLAGGTVIGVFSFRSLAAGLHTVRRNDDPLEAHVEDFVEDLAFVRAGDEVGEILAHLDRDGAVLIGDEQNLVAVATTSDVTSLLWEATRPFVLLQDIELAIRDLMRSACPSSTEMSKRIGAADKTPAADGSARLEDLTMSGLLSVLLNGPNFGQCFSLTFGTNRDLVKSQLEPTREIRNKVFHFRDDVTAEELNTLIAARKWLLRKVQIVQAK
jgi:CBS domain-containing protein